ncbi:MAG: response regulator [candidate division KSB1 bacterium]
MSTAELTCETFHEQGADTMQKSILIVDDEEDLTWSISKTLAKHDKDFEVLCAHDGDEAMAVLARRAVDVVISDIRMPGRDGLQVLHEINARYPRTKVIIMTAYGSHDTRKQIAARGSALYLEKPFEIRSLRQLIYEALALTPPDRGNFSDLNHSNPSHSSGFDSNLFFKERLDCYSGMLNAVLLFA